MTTVAQHLKDIDGHTAQEWTMRYTMVKRSARLTRLHTRRTLTNWSWRGETEDAVLIVSELVTNAIEHGRVPGHQLALRLTLLECGGLVIDVSDPVPDFPNFADAIAHVGPHHPEQGRGLLVATRLGAEITWFPRKYCGKTVRARLVGPPGCQDCTDGLSVNSQARPRRFVARDAFAATSRTAPDISLEAFRADQDATAETRTDALATGIDGPAAVAPAATRGG